jgi:hypothetical protein
LSTDETKVAQGKLLYLRKRAGATDNRGGPTSVQAAIERIARDASTRANRDDDEVRAWEKEQRRLKIESADKLRYNWALLEAGMPERFLEPIVAGQLRLQWGPIQFAVNCMADGELIVGLMGKMESGKTQAACLALWSHKRQKDIAKIDHPHGRGSTAGGRFLSAARYAEMTARDRDFFDAVPFLVLDDLGREPDNKHRLVEDLVFNRHANNKPTVFTSNLSMADLSGPGWDPRVKNRLERNGKVMEFDEPFTTGRTGNV